MTEEWRGIESHPDYEVSSEGRVRRCVADRHGRGLGALLSPLIGNHGYAVVTLHRETRQTVRLVHRLVCSAFHGNPEKGQQAAHRDGCRLNNRADNLRWASASENNMDKHLHGTMRVGDNHHARYKPEVMPRGEAHGNAKLTEADVIAIRGAASSQKAIAQKFGVSQSLVSMVRARRIWAHI